LNEGHLQQAVDELTVASEIFKGTGHVLNGIRTELQLARTNRMLGKLAQAKLLLQPLAADEDGIGTSERGIAHRELGLCFIQDAQVSKAADHLEQAVVLFERAGDARELALTYRLLGDLMKEQDQLSLACDAYRNAALALEQAA
jgi:tetratricopeptide (TPR) repeat protein